MPFSGAKSYYIGFSCNIGVMYCIVASPPPKCYSAAKPLLQPSILISGSALPSFEGDFDPHAYIDWELKVEAEFDKYELSDHQMILAAASALTEHALVKWKYIYRHNNIPQTWTDFKMHFRDAYIPAYYIDHLLSKLQKLKQGSRTVKQYYHDFNICVLFGGLDECMEETMSRFM